MSDTKQFASRAEESRFLMLRLEKLERSNAELVRALELLLSRSSGLQRSATHDGLLNCEAIAIARAALATAKGEA